MAVIKAFLEELMRHFVNEPTPIERQGYIGDNFPAIGRGES